MHGFDNDESSMWVQTDDQTARLVENIVVEWSWGRRCTLPHDVNAAQASHTCLISDSERLYAGRAYCPSSDCDESSSVDTRNLQVRASDCQMVEAHLSRFTFGDISRRIMSKLDLNWDHRHKDALNTVRKVDRRGGISQHVTVM